MAYVCGIWASELLKSVPDAIERAAQSPLLTRSDGSTPNAAASFLIGLNRTSS
jgi:hypothetical protein